MAVGDIYQLVASQFLDSEEVLNVLYYKVVSEGSETPAELELAERFQGGVEAAWKAAVGEAVQFTCYRTQKIFPLPATFSLDTFTSGNGDLVGETLPATTAGLIQKKNPTETGKGKQGRVYVAGQMEGDVENGNMDLAQKARMETLMAALLANLTSTGGWEWNPVWATRAPASPFAFTGSVDWTVGVVMPRLATQRRRRTPVPAFNP